MEKVLLFMGVFILISFVSAQKDFLQENKKPLKIGTGNSSDIHIIQILQLWDISTLQAAGSSGIDRRNDLYIRRGRIGLKGKLTKDLSFYVLFAYDGIGRDKNTAGNGSPNASDNHDFYLWDAYWTWNHVPMLNITAGYFRPQ